MDRPHPAACPYCGSELTHGHGSFPRQDGNREPRRRCCSCRRTFCAHTGTPLHYIKKRNEWKQMTRKMSAWQPLRRMARILTVHPSTAFRWRHCLLAAITAQPKPRLTGLVMASEAYVAYSEKGSRRTSGPGSWGARAAHTGPSRFRRFVHGKPSCILVACAGNQRALELAGQGRPSVVQLKTSLSRLLGTHAKLQVSGLLPYADACRALKVPLSQAPHFHGPVDRLRGGFYTWLRQMCGIATRYLPHYLTWFARIAHNARPQPEPGTTPAA